jgi:hypothetical protein
MRTLRIVQAIALLVLATLLATGATAQETTSEDPAAVAPSQQPLEVLFVQSFTSGQLAPAGQPGAAVLTLREPLGDTVYFADRPNRAAGTVETDEFLRVLA